MARRANSTNPELVIVLAVIILFIKGCLELTK
jgi:hypothetical protein